MNIATAHKVRFFRKHNLLLILALLLFVTTLVRTAWMNDDAHITIRAVDNFVNGYGPRWNVDERVQAFTHPLWMLLLSSLYAITKEGYFTSLFLSMAISLFALGLLAFKVADSWRSGVFAVAALMFSNSFVTYSTSGLENPLTHLLVVLFVLALLWDKAGESKLFLISLITSLAILNRQDIALMLMPAYLLSVWKEWRVRRGSPLRFLGIIVLGFLPIILWEFFSLFYYGAIFPNTYYAKLGAGVSHTALVQQGFYYFLASTVFDPIGFLLIITALFVALWKRTAWHLALATGVILYLLFVIWVGGDFMEGRFFTGPILLAVVILIRSQLFTSNLTIAAPLVLMTVLSLQLPYSLLFSPQPMRCDGQRFATYCVWDERSCYYDGTGLLTQKSDAPIHPNHWLAEAGLNARSRPEPIFIFNAIGMFGYFAGPEKHIVDILALADPLLARLPVPPDKTWCSGHFERTIPGGYLESLVWHENRICEPHLHHFYDELTLITQGELLDARRLEAIWRMNTSQYDADIEAYVQNATTDESLLCNAQQIVDIPFAGGPRLRGYALSTRTARPGQKIIVTAYWQVEDDHDSPLASFIHIRNSRSDWPTNPHSGNDIWVQSEHYEPGGVIAPVNTKYWPLRVYPDLFFLTLPEDIPPGEYNVEIGWFDPETGEQLDPVDEAIVPPLRELGRSLLLPPLTVQ